MCRGAWRSHCRAPAGTCAQTSSATSRTASPKACADRPTRAHEHLFLFSKSERYQYDVEAVKGPNGRRLRSVWDVKTQASPEASGHFATFSPRLIEPCVRTSMAKGDVVIDPFVGSGTTALVAAAQHRRFVGIELNPEHLTLARKRLTRASVREVLLVFRDARARARRTPPHKRGVTSRTSRLRAGGARGGAPWPAWRGRRPRGSPGSWERQGQR